ncbi:inositol monophosphatase family protein [Shimia aestuarii]|uniref:inositol monophosphatase family protein n=1 Tax=Shimia aestuarii TaxID=254406 RepID=UPI001FB203C0|nr:inositol monophosphatase family protein [Shimia aestuarii]
MNTPLEEIGAIAEKISREASAIPMAHFRAALDIDAKADDSPVTVADRKTEAYIRDALQSAFPDHGIFGEEYGISGSLDGETWIIDPIDGTRSFITGSPLFGMLLGFLAEGRPKLGLVRMPALDETFVGLAGSGATLNGAAIHCRQTRTLSEAMIYLNEGERLAGMNPELFGRLCRSGHTRRMAYDCYPHALVAAGQIDAVVDCGLEPYDYLPLVGLIEAAGGVITDWQGRDLTLDSDGKVVTAATPELLQEMLELING